jgi:ABC-type antimicrobial peptide transport system permease subunit
LSTTPPGTTLGNPDGVVFNRTDAEYFNATGIQLVRGRMYTPAEVRTRAPIAVITEQLVRQYWGLDDPLGASLERVNKRHAQLRVIGVATDAFMFGLQARPTAMVFLPGVEASDASMIVRLRDPRASHGAVQQALASLSADVRSDVFVVADRFDREMARPRGVAIVATAIAALALGLSLVGLYGVTVFLVRVRTREIGIRIALGARAVDVVHGLAREGMRPVVIGLLAGMVASMLVGRVVAGMLYGISARDPIALGGGTMVLLVTTLIAILMPARRAARIDPATTLRDSA